jgi:hypothetical protein
MTINCACDDSSRPEGEAGAAPRLAQVGGEPGDQLRGDRLAGGGAGEQAGRLPGLARGP